jgi:hypothetical protein
MKSNLEKVWIYVLEYAGHHVLYKTNLCMEKKMVKISSEVDY